MASPAPRSGSLVLWLVIGWILCVTALIFAIYFYVDSDRVNKRIATLETQYKEIVAPEMIKSEDIDKLRTAKDKNDPASGLNSAMKLIDVAIAQRNRLANLIGGNEEIDAAVATAANLIDKSTQAGARPAGASLAATVDALLAELSARTAEAQNAAKDSKTSKDKLLQTVAAIESQVKSLTDAMEKLRAEKDAALQEVQRITQRQSQGFEDTAAGLRRQLRTAQEQINQVNAQNADLGAQVRQLNTELDNTRRKLNDIRVDPAKAVVRQADGRIVRVPGNNLCFISLGTGDQVTPGLTFEVFDKVDGIPPPGDPLTEENLPKGKAALEIIRVGATTSECRITRLSPGAALSEGDLIVNLVYDKNTKYNFVVHGNFDLDQNGVATTQDAEVMKRLITQWGANVVADINVDTDFVVLGKEPVIPDPPAQDDPIAKAKYDAAIAEYESYGEISLKARAYRIPILNQNRFLYLIGYYELAKR